ncbi:MAG: hypothetical protein ABIP65_04640 [Vicinamibacterales bacterium]
MHRAKRLASSLLCAAGLVLVLDGLTTTLGRNVPGMLASVAMITALLYAAGVWFVPRAGGEPSILVFNSTLTISGGPLAGRAVLSQFPLWMRGEIERRCKAAVAGEYSRFTCADLFRSRTFDAAPIMSRQGAFVCAVLIEGAAIPAPTMIGERALSAAGG